MIRRKFYVPKEEVTRDYRKNHSITPNDIICKCDYVEEDEEYSI